MIAGQDLVYFFLNASGFPATGRKRYFKYFFLCHLSHVKLMRHPDTKEIKIKVQIAFKSAGCCSFGEPLNRFMVDRRHPLKVLPGRQRYFQVGARPLIAFECARICCKEIRPPARVAN